MLVEETSFPPYGTRGTRRRDAAAPQTPHRFCGVLGVLVALGSVVLTLSLYLGAQPNEAALAQQVLVRLLRSLGVAASGASPPRPLGPEQAVPGTLLLDRTLATPGALVVGTGVETPSVGDAAAAWHLGADGLRLAQPGARLDLGDPQATLDTWLQLVPLVRSTQDGTPDDGRGLWVSAACVRTDGPAGRGRRLVALGHADQAPHLEESCLPDPGCSPEPRPDPCGPHGECERWRGGEAPPGTAWAAFEWGLCRCAPGYQGPQCQECRLGYVRRRGECLPAQADSRGCLADPRCEACDLVEGRCTRCQDGYATDAYGACSRCAAGARLCDARFPPGLFEPSQLLPEPVALAAYPAFVCAPRQTQPSGTSCTAASWDTCAGQCLSAAPCGADGFLCDSTCKGPEPCAHCQACDPCTGRCQLCAPDWALDPASGRCECPAPLLACPARGLCLDVADATLPSGCAAYDFCDERCSACRDGWRLDAALGSCYAA